MGSRSLTGVEHWVFDLDNTLYPPSVNLFAQIEDRLNKWIVSTLGLTRDEADQLRVQYWERYGTTLAGVVAEHDVDPGTVLAEIHDVSFDSLRPDPLLAAAIGRLPGRRVIFTNASATYAARVLEARGLDEVFHAIFGVEEAEFRSKPQRAAYDKVFAKAAVEPRRTAMFDDDPRNLEVPHAMGMRTVHVSDEPVSAPHVDHSTADLGRFLSLL